MTTLQQAFDQLTAILKLESVNPRKEAEWLLTKITGYSQQQLYTGSEVLLTNAAEQQLTLLLQRLRDHEPLAYLLGTWEFWSLELKVTPDTLIPRPETERMVEWVLQQHPSSTALQAVDLGTGSGAIAIALAHERPLWQITATDISLAALKVAVENAGRHQLSNIQFICSHWCSALEDQIFDVVISNPPYIADLDPHWPDLRYEPQTALAGGADGLDAYRQIISQAKCHLKPAGKLVLEHGFDQAEAVSALLLQYGCHQIRSHCDWAGQPRFLTATYIL